MRPFTTDPRVWSDEPEQPPRWAPWVDAVIAALFATAYAAWMLSVFLGEPSWY